MKTTTSKSKDVLKDAELVERLTSVTEQLEDIVTITRGKGVREPSLSIERVAQQMRKKIGVNVPLVLFAIFRMFALKNLLRGRMHLTAYTIGKQLGLGLKISSREDFIRELKRYEISDMTIEKLDEEGVKLRLDGTITSLGIRNSTHPLCYFERGLLSGASEKLLGKKVNLVEENCCGKGDKHCLFKAVLKDQRKGHKIHMSDPLAGDLYSKENIKLLTTLASHSITAIENTLLYEEAKKQSMVDSLTRLYNHGYFQQALRVEAARALRYKKPLTLVMIDIDKFKNYNDSLGHSQGDKVLKSVAATLNASIREVDVAARYGGDEFALLLPNTDMAGALIVANRVKRALHGMEFRTGTKKGPTCFSFSIGVTVADGCKPVKGVELFESADKKLLLAKKRGGNRIVT